MNPGHQFPDAKPNTPEWRYGLQRNADENESWYQRRINSSSSRMWRQHKDEHTDTYRTHCIYCRNESRNTP